MNEDQFPRRAAPCAIQAAPVGSAATLAAGSGAISGASGKYPCCFNQRRKYSFNADLASRVTILEPDDKLAAYLGDGKEADDKTNPPVNQTNPALFAAPHSLAFDSKGDLFLAE